MRLHLESMAIEMPRVSRHPNRQPFHGVLTLLDVPSDKAPSGARGRRVLLTRHAAEAALPSLLGMALDYTPELDGHDARRKVGIITAAEIVPVKSATAGASQIDVRGYLFARDFPEVVQRIRSAGRRELGMSYEVADARVSDVRAAVWTLVEFTFTGAAVLLREKAAYATTWIALGSPEGAPDLSAARNNAARI
jgi:hypothetical protein